MNDLIERNGEKEGKSEWGKGRRPGVQAGEHFSLFAEASINGAKSPSFPPSFSAISLIFNICRREEVWIRGALRALAGHTTRRDGRRTTDGYFDSHARARSLPQVARAHAAIFCALVYDVELIHHCHMGPRRVAQGRRRRRSGRKEVKIHGTEGASCSECRRSRQRSALPLSIGLRTGENK